jgi:hypothetical protein
MIEGSGQANNAFSLMEVLADGTIRVRGFLRQKNYQWA